MSRLIALAVILLGFWFLFRGRTQRSAPEPPSVRIPDVGTLTPLHPVPAEGPPPEVVSALMFAQYEAIEKAGGMAVTLTATGKSMVLHPKLYQARTDSCIPYPRSTRGEYECHLTIQLSLSADGSDPSWKGERLHVEWDAVKGKWK